MNDFEKLKLIKNEKQKKIKLWNKWKLKKWKLKKNKT